MVSGGSSFICSEVVDRQNRWYHYWSRYGGQFLLIENHCCRHSFSLMEWVKLFDEASSELAADSSRVYVEKPAQRTKLKNNQHSARIYMLNGQCEIDWNILAAVPNISPFAPVIGIGQSKQLILNLNEFVAKSSQKKGIVWIYGLPFSCKWCLGMSILHVSYILLGSPSSR